jgi:hypothetical protein
MNQPILNKQNLKQLLIATTFSAVALALTGCAGSNVKPTYVDASQLTPEEAADAAYIARVERLAKARGIHLTWVNAPHHAPTVTTTVLASADDK